MRMISGPSLKNGAVRTPFGFALLTMCCGCVSTTQDVHCMQSWCRNERRRDDAQRPPPRIRRFDYLAFDGSLYTAISSLRRVNLYIFWLQDRSNWIVQGDRRENTCTVKHSSLKLHSATPTFCLPTVRWHPLLVRYSWKVSVVGNH